MDIFVNLMLAVIILASFGFSCVIMVDIFRDLREARTRRANRAYYKKYTF